MKNYIIDFLEYLEINRGLSQGTIKEYEHYLIRFSNWLLKNYPNYSLENLSIDIVNKYRVYLSRLSSQGNPIKQNTQGYHIVALRNFLRYLIVHKNMNVISPDKIELPKSTQRQINFLTNEQINRLLNAPDVKNIIGLRDKAILEILYSTGMRVSELIRLNRDNIDYIRKEFTVKGKGNKLRVAFLSDVASEWLKRYIESREDNYLPLFIRYTKSGKLPKIKNANDKHGESLRLTVRTIQNIVYRYTQKSGISMHVSPHTIRHSFATDLLIAGADLRSVQEILGHNSIRTTQVYTHVTNKHLKEVYQTYHRR